MFQGVFLSQDSDTAKTSGLPECAKAVNKANLGRRLLVLTWMGHGCTERVCGYTHTIQLTNVL